VEAAGSPQDPARILARGLRTGRDGKVREGLSLPPPDAGASRQRRPRSLVPSNTVSPGGYLLNSRGFREAAIPPDTWGLKRDPKTGKLTGHADYLAGEMFTMEALPWTPVEPLSRAIKTEMLRENAAGLTTVVTRVSGNDVSAIKLLWERGELTMRWRVGHEFLRGNPTPGPYLKRLGNLNGLGDDMLKITGLSFQAQDSAMQSGGAYTWEAKRMIPEGAEHTGLTGIDKWEDPERSERKNITLAIQYGWSITGMHSQGSRSNSALLGTADASSPAPHRSRPRKSAPLISRSSRTRRWGAAGWCSCASRRSTCSTAPTSRRPPDQFLFNAQARHVFRDLVDMPATVDITARDVTVTFHRRAHLPILMASGLFDQPVKVPWWDNRTLRLTTDSA